MSLSVQIRSLRLAGGKPLRNNGNSNRVVQGLFDLIDNGWQEMEKTREKGKK